MHNLLEIIFIIFMLINLHLMQDLSELILRKKCREKNRLISTDKYDLYSLVEAPVGEKLMLQCHYCSEEDDHQPKNWYRMNSFINSTMREVTLDMETNVTINKIHVNIDHTLVINNIDEKDCGLYFCIGLEGQEAEKKYNYLIDTVIDKNYTFETGDLVAWKKYQQDYLEPINGRFKKSVEHDFKRLRRFLVAEIITYWDAWGPCELCGRPAGDGRKTRIGFCRLKLKRHNRQEENNVTFTKDQLFILNANEISCRSTLLSRDFPIISNLTRVLPYFIQYEHCEGTCNPDAEGIYKGWKSTKKGYKYKKTFVLAEGSHLSIVCPESTLENVVIWRKDGKDLKRGTSYKMNLKEPDATISIDTFNTIYFHGVTSAEEGNYTCVVDDVRMQQVRIFVVSKSKLLTQAFVRHLMYLGFVLSLTLTCYCAGLFLTWRRRNKFKKYEELRLLNKHKDNDITDDDDDGPSTVIEIRTDTETETNVDYDTDTEIKTASYQTKAGTETTTRTETIAETVTTSGTEMITGTDRNMETDTTTGTEMISGSFTRTGTAGTYTRTESTTAGETGTRTESYFDDNNDETVIYKRYSK